ncbi:MAG: hypothetical protein JWM19_3870 [Actinomycetia bacterium]|nr:hypothetical protein [Actinomycetes bacterium]
MRLRRHRHKVVVWSSSVHPAGSFAITQYRRVPRTGRIGRCIRISVLLTIIVVRPRWRTLLAGMALTVAGIVQRDSVASVLLVPGLLVLWQSLLITPDPEADRERRSQLASELAAFSTPAQRRDLEATLDRYPDGITHEIRNVLASQAAGAHNTGIPGASRY